MFCIADPFSLTIQEQPPFDKKLFLGWVKKYIKNLTPKLEPEAAEVFKKNIEPATKFLLSKLKDLQLYVFLSIDHFICRNPTYVFPL